MIGMEPSLMDSFDSVWVCCSCFLFLGYIVIHGLCGWFIFRKAGMEPALGLLMAIPLLNLILLLYLAFAAWPVEKELKYFMGDSADGPRRPEERKGPGLRDDGDSSLFD